MITKKPLNGFKKILKKFSVTKYFGSFHKIPTRFIRNFCAIFQKNFYGIFGHMSIIYGESLYRKKCRAFF